MEKDWTELVFILDRSGSMTGLESDTIGGAVHFIQDKQRAAKEKDRPAKTLFVITTDGLENASRNYSYDTVRRIDERGVTDTEVYKRANLSRKLFSKIRSNPVYQPKKSTAVALALALWLNMDETRDFLSRAGYAFSPGSVFDLIVSYFIEQGEYDIYTINLTLFEYEQPLLGD